MITTVNLMLARGSTKAFCCLLFATEPMKICGLRKGTDCTPERLNTTNFYLSYPGGIVFIKSATSSRTWFTDGVSSFRQLLLALLICLATAGPASLLAQSDNS